MESLFPDLLFLGPFFAPLLLRAAAASAYAVIAYALYKNRNAISKERFPVVGTLSPSLASLGAAVSLALALAFAAGIFTQAAAVIGAIGAVKGSILSKKHPLAFPGGRLAYILLFFISLALAITGAGAFAVDVPY